MIRALVLAGLLTLVCAGHAQALPSDVKLGCLSGSTALGPPPPAGVGSGACTLIASATASGFSSGMGFLFRPTVSPDGRNLYALGGVNLFATGTVVTFNRNPATGALSFAGCITGDTALAAVCTPLPSAAAGAAGSGMGSASDLAVAPDGASVYVAAPGDDAVTTFQRNAATGSLTFLECDTGNTAVSACAGVGSATAGGVNSGLDRAGRLAVAPGNDVVAVTSAGDDAIVLFTRTAGSGALTPEGCRTGEVATGPDGSGACPTLPGSPSSVTAGGIDSGFNELGAVAYSPDGLNLYLASTGDDTVTTLTRPSSSAQFDAVAQCLSGSIAMGPAPDGNNRCSLTDNPTASGAGSNLDGPASIVVPGDGLDVLVTTAAAGTVTTFARTQPPALPAPAPPVGALAFTGCVTGFALAAAPCATTPVTGPLSGLTAPLDLAVAPDNTTVLVAASGGFAPAPAEALATLTRNTTSGAIAFTRCTAGNTAAGPGGSGACALLASAQPGGGGSGQALTSGVAVSPDNRNVYVTGAVDSAITWYGNDADGDGVGDQADNCPAAANAGQSDLDGDATGDACDATPTGPSPPPGTGGPGTPGGASTAATPPPAAPKAGARAVPEPALLKVRSAVIGLRAGRRTLRVDATVSSRADGQPVALRYRSSGVTTRRSVRVTNGRLRAAVPLPATQPLTTGVVTISLPAAAGVRGQQVQVRAADRPPALKTAEARILNKKLRVSGTISPLATGVVLIRMEFSDKAGNPLSVSTKARIFNGRWKTLLGLEPDARDGGAVTILYPGLARSAGGPIRGEQDARAIGVGR